MTNLKESVNGVLHEHLASVLAVLLIIFSTAVGFWWTTQVDVISQVSANGVRSERNEGAFSDIQGQLQNIQGAVQETSTSVAVIREKVDTLEKELRP